jgi:hypothetical protein
MIGGKGLTAKQVQRSVRTVADELLRMLERFKIKPGNEALGVMALQVAERILTPVGNTVQHCHFVVEEKSKTPRGRRKTLSVRFRR